MRKRKWMVGTRSSLVQLGLQCEFNSTTHGRPGGCYFVRKRESVVCFCILPLLPPFYALFGLTNVQAIAAHSWKHLYKTSEEKKNSHSSSNNNKELKWQSIFERNGWLNVFVTFSRNQNTYCSSDFGLAHTDNGMSTTTQNCDGGNDDSLTTLRSNMWEQEKKGRLPTAVIRDD